MKNLNKKDLVNQVANLADLTKKDTKLALDAFFDVLVGVISDGASVTVAGFGKFTPRVRAARKGRNVHTGESIDIGERKVVSFKAGKTFKNILNG